MEPTKYDAWGTGAVPVPPGVLFGWGARAIDHGSNGWDLLPDRQGFFGKMAENEEVRGVSVRELNGGIIGEAHAKYKAEEGRAIGGYVLFDLYEDDKWVLKGRKSGGYVHLAAWLKEGTREATEARVRDLQQWLEEHQNWKEGTWEQKDKFKALKNELAWLEEEIS